MSGPEAFRRCICPQLSLALVFFISFLRTHTDHGVCFILQIITSACILHHQLLLSQKLTCQCMLTNHRITQTQNHGMAGVGRDLCGSSSPSLLPKQGHLQQAAQDLVQAGLEYLQRRRLHSLPGQPGPGLHHPQREEVLPHVGRNFLCFSLCPVVR